jgi:hypothetical protein
MNMDQIGKIGANLAMELTAEHEFKPSGDGDFHCATRTHMLLVAACGILAKQNAAGEFHAEDKLHALLRGFHDQIVKHYMEKDMRCRGLGI